MTTLATARTAVGELAGRTTTDRRAYREHAQWVADAGFIAVIEEFFSNSDGDPTPLTFSIQVFTNPADDADGAHGEYLDYLGTFGDDPDMEPDSRVSPDAKGGHINPPEERTGPMGGSTTYEVFRPGVVGGSIFGTTPADEIAEFDPA